jgi:hypothetical protein
MTKLSQDAFVMRERELQKSAGLLTSGAGATPAPYDPVPDYAEIYYQPESDERRQDESDAAAVRRRAMGQANRGKYGFHGTADPSNTPQLRYEMDDYPNSERREEGMMHFKPNAIGEYTQPVSDDIDEDEEPDDPTTSGALNEDKNDEQGSEVTSQRLRRKKPAGVPTGPTPRFVMPVGKFAGGRTANPAGNNTKQAPIVKPPSAEVKKPIAVVSQKKFAAKPPTFTRAGR